MQLARLLGTPPGVQQPAPDVVTQPEPADGSPRVPDEITQPPAPMPEPEIDPQGQPKEDDD